MLDSVVVRSFDVQVNAARGSTILVRGRDVFDLGDVEEFIWSLCDGTRTVGQIAAEVVAGFDVDEQTARDDVCEFIGDLRDEKLVELGVPE